MNKSTLGTKDTKAIDIPQLGHGFTTALCSGALEGYRFFGDSYHHRFYCLMWLLLQHSLLRFRFEDDFPHQSVAIHWELSIYIKP